MMMLMQLQTPQQQQSPLLSSIFSSSSSSSSYYSSTCYYYYYPLISSSTKTIRLHISNHAKTTSTFTTNPKFSTNTTNSTTTITTKMKNKNKKKKVDYNNNETTQLNQSLSEAIHHNQWSRALQVFEMLKEQPSYQPKQGTYMKLIALLGKCGQPGQACRLFDVMLKQGLEPSSGLYTALIAACCRSNLIDKAFSILDEMKSHSLCQPDVNTYTILIKACVDASRFKLVDSLYVQMAQQLITPSTVTQNIVLSGYGRAGKYDEMENILSSMLESATSIPDVWTLNTVLSLFGNKGQIEMMERWYKKLCDFGIEPESRTFNIMIGAYGKTKMYDKMSSVMEYMRGKSYPWTTTTYNNVIEAFSDAGDAKNMEYMYNEMRGEGMKADGKTLCSLIRGYANAGQFDKVMKSVELAARLEIPENTSFFNSVIYACALAKDLVEMDRIFKRMKDKAVSRLDSRTYSIMIDAYRKEGSAMSEQKVFDLEQEMQMMRIR